MSSGNKRVIQITNESDGTGEADVVKIDKSAFTLLNGKTPLAIDIDEITFQVDGFNYVVLEWDNASDTTIAVLKGNGMFDYRPYGGLKNPSPLQAATSGDVIIRTDGGTDGASYNILIAAEFREQ